MIRYGMRISKPSGVHTASINRNFLTLLRVHPHADFTPNARLNVELKVTTKRHFCVFSSNCFRVKVA